MDAGQFETLLRASLELWRVEASLRLCAPATAMADTSNPARASLQAWLGLADGTRLQVVEAGPQDEPFRWWLHWHAGPAVDGVGAGAILRRKPCASTLGLLRSLREALGVAAVAKVRIGGGAGVGAPLA